MRFKGVSGLMIDAKIQVAVVIKRPLDWNIAGSGRENSAATSSTAGARKKTISCRRGACKGYFGDYILGGIVLR